MPFKVPEAPKCPKCSKSVFAAEEKVAGGFKWHKSCFKCDNCNKLLDSTTCAEHARKLYCKTCHGRNYGPKGYGFGAGAGTLLMDSNNQGPLSMNIMTVKNGNVSQAPEGEGCPRCGGYVYHADQIFSKGRAWHKGCFKCSICHRVLDSRIACDGPDNDVYCTGCYRKKFGIKGYGFGQASGPALLSGDHVESQENPTISLKGVDTTIIQAKPGEGCPRCGGQVFHAEQMFSKGKTYHKKCFTCNSCKKPLDSVSCCDAPDGEIYCKGCYGKTFGTKGYGFGMGAGFLQCADGQTERHNNGIDTTSIQGNGKDSCPRCGGQVFHAEKMLSKLNAFHKSCFSCYECRRPLDSTSCCDAPDGEIYCKQCYGKKFGPKGYGFGGTGSIPALTAASSEEIDRIQVDFLPKEKKAIDGFGCPRCGYSVYEAEKLIAAQKAWHKRCFTCAECNRHLDSTTVNDGPDGDIYCSNCYAVKFGIRGYGFGIGGGALQTEGENGHKISSESAFILP